jgi:hypothetical protein
MCDHVQDSEMTLEHQSGLQSLADGLQSMADGEKFVSTFLSSIDHVSENDSPLHRDLLLFRDNDSPLNTRDNNKSLTYDHTPPPEQVNQSPALANRSFVDREVHDHGVSENDSPLNRDLSRDNNSP